MTTILGRGPMSQTTITSNKDAIESDRSIWKIVVLAAIGIIFSFSFGLFSKFFILDSQWNFLLFAVLAGTVFLAFFLLNIFFIKTFWIHALIILGESLALSVAFYDNFSFTILIGAVIGFLFLIQASSAGRAEIDNMLKIKFSQVGRKSLPKAITAIALFLGFAYLGIFAPLDSFILGKGNFELKQFFISKSSLEAAISPLNKIDSLKNLMPGIDFSLPVGEIIKNMAVSQVEQNPQLKSLPASLKKPLINQAVQASEKQLVNFVGSPVDMKAKIADVIYNWLLDRFTGLPDTFKAIISIGVAFLVFLTIIGFIWPVRLIATFFAYIFYEIFLATGFSVKMMEERSREIVILK
jgi:hypothetical protein